MASTKKTTTTKKAAATAKPKSDSLFPMTPQVLAGRAVDTIKGEPLGTTGEVEWHSPAIAFTYGWLYRTVGRPQGRKFEITREVHDEFLGHVKDGMAKNPARMLKRADTKARESSVKAAAKRAEARAKAKAEAKAAEAKAEAKPAAKKTAAKKKAA